MAGIRFLILLPKSNLGIKVYTYVKYPGHPSRFITREDAMAFSAGFLFKGESEFK
jgi:hypothetical protein